MNRTLARVATNQEPLDGEYGLLPSLNIVSAAGAALKPSSVNSRGCAAAAFAATAIRDAAAAELAFRQSALDQDQQRQIQAQQLAQQQFANSLAAWFTYMQAVNARQPQTVHFNETIRVQ